MKAGFQEDFKRHISDQVSRPSYRYAAAVQIEILSMKV